MFNGVIYNKGIVKSIRRSPRYVSGSLVIEIAADIKFKKSDIGESVCCDGVCLTLINIRSKLMEFYLSDETLKRSKFKKVKIGDQINIETPLKFGNQISGHITQGHIDFVGKISSIINSSWESTLVANKTKSCAIQFQSS